MDPSSFQNLICAACGRIFMQPTACSNHVRSCRFQRKRTASALEIAKETYRNKKICHAVNQAQASQLIKLNLSQQPTCDPAVGSFQEAVSIILSISNTSC